MTNAARDSHGPRRGCACGLMGRSRNAGRPGRSSACFKAARQRRRGPGRRATLAAIRPISSICLRLRLRPAAMAAGASRRLDPASGRGRSEPRDRLDQIERLFSRIPHLGVGASRVVRLDQRNALVAAFTSGAHLVPWEAVRVRDIRATFSIPCGACCPGDADRRRRGPAQARRRFLRCMFAPTAHPIQP